jgi:L-threonylcarbamoyladenylate synthase
MIFEEDIKQSLEILRNGGIIIYPTDTIWGIGCDATSKEGVDKIFAVKAREEGKSLIVLVNGIVMLERYVKEVPRIAYELAEVSESPLTIIYPEGKNLAEGICSTDGSVGIRICRDEFCSELISRLRKPIVSTSANISGKASPANFSEIDKSLIESVDYTVKYRRNDRQKNAASPVIKVDYDGTLKILRK